MLVKTQGERVDMIETYVYEATARAEQATEQLKSAANYQGKARKKKLIIAVIILVIIAIILIAVFAK